MSGYGRNAGGFDRRRNDDYQSEGGEARDEMFVPLGCCGKIIGRGGAQIRELQEQSQCRIKVSRDDEPDGSRRVELSGSHECIAQAKYLIQQIVDEGDRRPQQGGGGGGAGGGGGGPKKVLMIDSNCVGRIIGRGGSKIRELQDETRCRINVSRDGGRDGQTEVEIIGRLDDIDHAQSLILNITSQQDSY